MSSNVWAINDKVVEFLQVTIWDFVDKKNESEGQAWSQGKVKIPKASMFKVSLKHVSHQSVTLKC